ncbi:ankyrin repeat-containing domain protein [Xylaria bambusicola]|uniref:ankyrin repeat-containing domain protein n=1 Tax=Xylaria bambusicola TaxID=326684 RepID=UPI002008263D|nr:ankyrin repeat-containing domain protein [Xylaria bambusicola]KAI0513326.1 ankyrin repeat-containing domain protein [Xylaria bambusicola]
MAIDETLQVPNLAENYQHWDQVRWPEQREAVKSPLALAMAWGNEPIIELLLEHHATAKWPEPSAAIILQALSGNKANVRRLLTNRHGASSLQSGLDLGANALYAARAAAASGHVDIVNMMLQLISPSSDTRLSYLREIAHEAAEHNHPKILDIINKTASPAEREHIAGIKFLVAARHRDSYKIITEEIDGPFHRVLGRIKNEERDVIDLYSPSEVSQVYLEKALREAFGNLNLGTGRLLLEHPSSAQIVKVMPDILQVAMSPSYRLRWRRNTSPTESKQLQEIVHMLIGLGADVNGLDKHMRPPIHCACVHGLVDTFQALIDHGVSISEDKDNSPGPCEESDGNSHRNSDGDGVNLLKLTLDSINLQAGAQNICENWGRIVFKLLDNGSRIEPNYESLGNLLYAIAEFGDIELLEKLFKYGVNPNLPVKSRKYDEHFGSAINVAAVKDDVEIVRSLIKHGADVSAERCCLRPYEKKINATPIQAALQWGHEWRKWDRFWQICELLIEAGAGDEDCRSVLKAASERGNVVFTEQLLERGICLSEMPITQSLDIIKLLVEHGTPIDSPTGRAVELQRQAMKAGSCELLEYLITETGQLLSAGQLIDEGFTRFSKRQAEEQKRALVFLLQKGYISLNERCRCTCGKAWTNLLQKLIAGGIPDLVAYVLSEGADPQCPGCPDTAMTVLFKHAGEYYDKNEFIATAEKLLEHGASVDGIRDVSLDHDAPDQTPLLFALARSDWNMVEFLISRGADVNRGVISPLTLAYWAREKKIEFVELLRSKGAVTRPLGQVDVMALHAELRNGLPWLSYQYRWDCRWGGKDHC